MPLGLMAYIVILAEDTTKVTIGKEYGPGTTIAYQGPFLTIVGAITGYHSLFATATKPLFISQAIHAAMPWTERAFFHKLICRCYSLS